MMLGRAQSVSPSLATLIASLLGLTVRASNPIQFQPGMPLPEFPSLLRLCGALRRRANASALAGQVQFSRLRCRMPLRRQLRHQGLIHLMMCGIETAFDYRVFDHV
jgi:hypothetical protein